MATNKKRGLQTVSFINPPVISSWASIVGPKEGEGPWVNDFDWVLENINFGENTFEKAESKMIREVVKLALSKIELKPVDAELLLAGDLLNGLPSSNYAARELQVPFFGLYGSSSTMAEAIINGSMLVDGGFYERIISATGSHHYSVEKQFGHSAEQSRKTLSTSQWLTTGAGAVVLESSGIGPRITCATIGKVVDMEQYDINDLGSAISPAAADTIRMHFSDTNRSPNYYDLILTGDLGKFGTVLIKEFFIKYGITPEPNFSDCGVLMYRDKQDIEAGGTGCGCSAAMFCGPIMRKVSGGEINKLLFVGTGALISKEAYMQGETIPGIAHAIAIENDLFTTV
ncbi:Stage V sporulation protein AD (SpoVAD) [Candidatus Syntrophocurvum alkaliphilum]|uniref:Stage V sporulation protein AD (SpoVAD) n=1 Tax=Candidatus Syntrophocurvum alkaliphilum TaxID=2293317 RepID=A0A6I6DH92_9FIRM|nr:stage V sporulation protein AD [Candidatus Syntrophocurvum alkaliphilum]QGT98999.1 Stage V sporulation protein AD (SpoVAD) [Candidatus Syntrophocurvum alkaliphilum]